VRRAARTLGHADFSEDTYRTLHAADGAVMLLDCAKGVEAQTKKLFRVCRQRKLPIFTFVNKMDRPGRDPLDLVGEVEDVLGIGVYPITWPVYAGADARGVMHRHSRTVHLLERDQAVEAGVGRGARIAVERVLGLDDPALVDVLGEQGWAQLHDELELLEAAGDAFDHERFLAGDLSPMFFGSAMNNFGVETFLESFCEMMPAPTPRVSDQGIVPTAAPFSGFVFKIQANMDKAHRDRLAFLRICSGHFDRGMKVLHVRTGREIRLANPTTFMAQERTVVEDGYAGDVIGVYDPGIFEIGDTLTAKGAFRYEPIPAFSPEHFARVVMMDPMRRKQLKKGLDQLAQEGTIQIYRTLLSREGEAVLGAVGRLQLEVVTYRLEHEYDCEVRLEPMNVELARWVRTKDGSPVDLRLFDRERVGLAALTARGKPVVLFAGEWQLNSARRTFPDLEFHDTARPYPEPGDVPEQAT
jgi:peptide chain release factor 3